MLSIFVNGSTLWTRTFWSHNKVQEHVVSPKQCYRWQCFFPGPDIEFQNLCSRNVVC